MKKSLWSVLVILTLMIFLAPVAPANASSNEYPANKNLIIDDMAKISEKSMAELNKYAREISGAYGLDVAFFLVSNSYSPRQYFREHTRERYFGTQGLGPDGFTLVYDIDGGRWGVVGFGKATWIITDEARYRLWNAYYSTSQETGATFFDGAMAYLKEANDFLAELAAANDGNPFGSDAGLSFVEDKASLMPSDEREELKARAAEIAEKYQCEMYVVTVDDMYDFDFDYNYDYDDAFVFNLTLKTQFHLGKDTDGSCVVLCLSMEDRDYWLEAYGPAMWVFTDYGIDEMLDRHVLPQLAKDNWYEAFSAYLDKAEQYLQMARDGKPFDHDTDPAIRIKILILKLLVVILLPMLIALIICSIWKRQMKTAVLAKAADNYIPEGGFKLTGKDDMFLYRTTTQRLIKTSDSSSSGSSSSSRSRSHGSSRGRGGKF